MDYKKLTRREALKYLGTTMAGMTLAAAGSLSVIGIVFPDYRAFAPLMVQRFLQEVNLKAPYLFSIITFGNYDCNVIESWNKFAIEQGVHFNYITTVKMVDNYLPVFDMAEQIKMDKQEEAQLQQAVADVLQEKNHIPSLTEEERQQCLRVLQRVPKLRQADHCIGCNQCSPHCPQRIDIPKQMQRINSYVEELKAEE